MCLSSSNNPTHMASIQNVHNVLNNFWFFYRNIFLITSHHFTEYFITVMCGGAEAVIVSYLNKNYFQAIASLPLCCKIGTLILFLPQMYWFYLMVRGALKVQKYFLIFIFCKIKLLLNFLFRIP